MTRLLLDRIVAELAKREKTLEEIIMHRRSFRANSLRIPLGVMLFWSLMLLYSLSLAAPRPSTVIKSGAERALELLRKDCHHGETFVLRAHSAQIQKIVREYCDFPEMAMRALGPPWRSQPPAKQQEFVALFEQLIFNTYIDRVDTYTCADEQVIYDDETVEGNYAAVKSRVTGYKGKDIAIEYRLRLKNDEWKAYDVVVEGVSLVNNYRQQFSSILSRESFDDLLKRMREKVAAMK
jgi:phospholipid transport system substrate-binding protein